MRVLIIDNYDSFTFNLYQYIGEILSRAASVDNFEVLVKRNDELTLEQIKALQADRIIVSPGPGSPDDPAYFGVCREVILQLGKTTPLLGVCLGMQGIASCFGGKVVRAELPMHGKVSMIEHDGKGVYANMPQDLEIMRYHSLMVEAGSLPECLEINSVVKGEAQTSGGDFVAAASKGQEIMGLRHREYPIEGIQYHPESFATEGGQSLLRNFLMRN
ncbi:MAG: anthranilate/aminodeoxychorismate synthase component II [Alteromonadaceae bacterium]|nr:MAG: anthranilate/aminodeoxychorismate synthase component II [Alteromonadaceae bacterium]